MTESVVAQRRTFQQLTNVSETTNCVPPFVAVGDLNITCLNNLLRLMWQIHFADFIINRLVKMDF